MKRIYKRIRRSLMSLLKKEPNYHQDNLVSFNDCSFMNELKFITAYQRGVQSAGVDYNWHWRVHVALWVAYNCSKLEGAFVECGVNRGFLSSSIMEYLNWNELDRQFYLFDTFCGVDLSLTNSVERARGFVNYQECYEESKKNFEQFKNVRLIRGSVPSTLSKVDISKVCYLSIDMNCAAPEIAAAQFFWPKLTPGAMILLDDYAYAGYISQKLAFDAFAREHNTKVLSLPTGQGLIVK